MLTIIHPLVFSSIHHPETPTIFISHPLTHSPIYPLPLTHSSSNSFIQSSIQKPIHPFKYPPTQTPKYRSILLLIYPPIHPSINPSTHQPTHLFIHPSPPPSHHLIPHPFNRIRWMEFGVGAVNAVKNDCIVYNG